MKKRGRERERDDTFQNKIK